MLDGGQTHPIVSPSNRNAEVRELEGEDSNASDQNDSDSDSAGSQSSADDSTEGDAHRQGSSKTEKWWIGKSWPKELNRGKETSWFLGTLVY